VPLPPYYSLSLYLYTDCLARISLSYSDLSNNTQLSHPPHDSLDHQLCLHELTDAVSKIPQDKKPQSHHFYPYHREIGSLLLSVVTASASLFTARSQLNTWLNHLNTDTLLLPLPPLLVSYNETRSHLLEAIATQSSFHYMEPEAFYLSIRECSLPLLQEMNVVRLFLSHLNSLLGQEDNHSNATDTATDIDRLFESHQEALYSEEKQLRFPLRESVWHQRSYERYLGIKRRYSHYLLERQRSDQQSERSLERLIAWFKAEREQFWHLRREDTERGDSLRDGGGSCCELLYC
jgi:hypothetical protein